MGILFLIGPRGCGKTSAAERLAADFACKSCDTDQLLVATVGKSIPSIVAESGWVAFRTAEKAALAEAVTRMNAAGGGVVATGGGIVLAPENRDLMRQSGVVVYLAVPAQTLVERLGSEQEQSARPAFSTLPFDEEIRNLLKEREPLYRGTAHHVIDAGLRPDAVARALYGIFTCHCRETI